MEFTLLWAALTAFLAAFVTIRITKPRVPDRPLDRLVGAVVDDDEFPLVRRQALRAQALQALADVVLARVVGAQDDGDVHGADAH